MTRLEILEKPLWTLEDIKAFFEIKTTKASQLMQEAKKISISKFAPKKAKRDIILKLNGIDFEEEIKKQKLLRSN